jgi:hypothetical protein
MSTKSEDTAPVRGSCFCGAVAFEVTLPTLFCAHCHCTMCRRVHGAGYVTWIAVPYPQFRMVSGSEHLAVHHSSEHGRRSFCDVCSSSLFCESTHQPDQIDIVLANLADKIDRDPQAHYYFSDRAEWIAIADDLPRFGGETGTEPLK